MPGEARRNNEITMQTVHRVYYISEELREAIADRRRAQAILPCAESGQLRVGVVREDDGPAGFGQVPGVDPFHGSEV
jgi:hypothetical protein